MRDWSDVLPEQVARQQIRRERRDKMIRMREAGVRAKVIAKKMGVRHNGALAASTRYATIVTYGGRPHVVDRLRQLTPIEHYLIDDTDVRRLAWLIKKTCDQSSSE